MVKLNSLEYKYGLVEYFNNMRNCPMIVEFGERSILRFTVDGVRWSRGEPNIVPAGKLQAVKYHRLERFVELMENRINRTKDPEYFIVALSKATQNMQVTCNEVSRRERVRKEEVKRAIDAAKSNEERTTVAQSPVSPVSSVTQSGGKSGA